MVHAPPLAFPQVTAEYRGQIDSALLDYAGGLDEGCPAKLREAVLYSLMAPGKRLRPQMALMAAKACGATNMRAVMPAACAVEMIHTYSLIHDDLPSMDDDDLRRGRPTSHKVFGEAMAILAGDALLTWAFELLAREVSPPDVAATCCAVLALAAGAGGMVGGQVEDLENAKTETPTVELAVLESIHRRKTGAMFVVSLELGGLAAGADRHQLSLLNAFGSRLGLAFQIMDDLLDVQGEESSLGKRVGKDAGHGKLTFPSLLGVEASRRRAESLMETACQTLKPFGTQAAELQSLARYVVERKR